MDHCECHQQKWMQKSIRKYDFAEISVAKGLLYKIKKEMEGMGPHGEYMDAQRRQMSRKSQL